MKPKNSMDAATLRLECQRQIDRLGPDAHIRLVIPGQPTGRRMRLFGSSGGPFGKPLVHRQGFTTCVFRARDILAWLDRQGVRR